MNWHIDTLLISFK